MKKAWYEKEESIKIIAFLLIVCLFGGIYLLLPEFFTTVLTLITSGNVNELIDFLRSFGIWAILISFLLDVLINALGFLPSIFLSTANGVLFGLPIGILVSWIAETVGVIISFLLMRYFFRGSAEMLIKKNQNLERLDQLSGEKGLQLMTILRTLPYFPSGILTALGAVSSMSIRDYVIANFIGKFPSTALEVIVGHDIVNFGQHMERLAMIATLIAVIYGYMLWRNKKKK